jgi:membrane associated rhomboid family serine protease
MVGASGAIYGLLMAIALLFPNTQFMLLFPPIPIKAKYLALILGGIALISGIQGNPGDNVAHFAHLGGMIFAFIMIKIWQKDRNQFY